MLALFSKMRGFVLLFIPHKEFFLKVIFVFLYFMSVTVKFTPAWILGTYFSTLKTGIPLLPGWSTALATNIVIFTQVVECWFLLSSRPWLQRMSFAYAIFFHLYSGILVLYDYPSITLPIIAILFGPMYKFTKIPFDKKALGGWVLIAAIALFQLLGFIIPTDRFLTLEGNRFGMFMFEANHACVATVNYNYSYQKDSSTDFEAAAGTSCSGFYCLVSRNTVRSATSSVEELRYESGTAWNRCDPYEWWTRLHNECARNLALTRVGLTFDHSINGGPFLRIIDTQNICNLSYRPWVHNDWIKFGADAPIVGYPLQNLYHY